MSTSNASARFTAAHKATRDVFASGMTGERTYQQQFACCLRVEYAAAKMPIKPWLPVADFYTLRTGDAYFATLPEVIAFVSAKLGDGSYQVLHMTNFFAWKGDQTAHRQVYGQAEGSSIEGIRLDAKGDAPGFFYETGCAEAAWLLTAPERDYSQQWLASTERAALAAYYEEAGIEIDLD